MVKNIFYFLANYFNRLYIILSVLAVFLGGIIYILLRPYEPVFFDWISKLGMDNWVSPARQNSLYFTHLFPKWFIYSFPSFLWAFAYSILITGIWWQSKSPLKYFWFSTIPFLIIGWEVFQLMVLLPGTFSPGDIIMGVIGILAGIFIGIKLTKLKYHEKEIV